MTKLIVALFTLFLIQCTFAQCIGSRMDAFGPFANIPTEYLALANYGAVDYLSSPALESVRRNILSTFPAASLTEVACDNILGSPNQFAGYEPSYALTQRSLPVPFISESSLPNLRPLSVPEIFSRISSFTPSTNIKCLGGYGPASLAASRGGGLFVTSSSPGRPTGISIVSENEFQGSLSVTGRLPFLGTVSLGDTLPSYGYGTVNYNCGAGTVAMMSENSASMPCGRYP